MIRRLLSVGCIILVFPLLEGSVISLPFSLLSLIFLATTRKHVSVFFLAIVNGLILDLITLRPLGITGIFYTVFLFLLFLYERKYETSTLPFILSAVFVGVLIYSVIFNNTHITLQIILSIIIITLVYSLSAKIFRSSSVQHDTLFT
jgi:cell shape-determining protein MreD